MLKSVTKRFDLDFFNKKMKVREEKRHEKSYDL